MVAILDDKFWWQHYFQQVLPLRVQIVQLCPFGLINFPLSYELFGDDGVAKVLKDRPEWHLDK